MTISQVTIVLPQLHHKDNYCFTLNIYNETPPTHTQDYTGAEILL